MAVMGMKAASESPMEAAPAEPAAPAMFAAAPMAPAAGAAEAEEAYSYANDIAGDEPLPAPEPKAKAEPQCMVAEIAEQTTEAPVTETVLDIVSGGKSSYKIIFPQGDSYRSNFCSCFDDVFQIICNSWVCTFTGNFIQSNFTGRNKIIKCINSCGRELFFYQFCFYSISTNFIHLIKRNTN